MQKILLIFPLNFETDVDTGVKKKCIAQVEAYKRLGYEVDYCHATQTAIMCNGQPIRTFQRSSLIRKYFTQLKIYSVISKALNLSSYSIIHIRYAYSIPSFIKFLKLVKRNSSSKIILEIPTYPYSAERGSYLKRFLYSVDRFYVGDLKYYVDRIITYAGQEIIYGVPTIKLTNGIDVSMIAAVKSNLPTDIKEIKLAAVANISFWHGFDRVIRGLATYYNGRDETDPVVRFYIVGDGSAVPDLKSLVKQLNLTQYIQFVGVLQGKELNDFLENIDIGISTLAAFRKNIFVHSSLKSREYCVRGIPFVFADEDPDFTEDDFFIMKVTSDEEAISVSNIVGFYRKVIDCHPQYKERMYDFAQKNLSWESKLRAAVQALESGY